MDLDGTSVHSEPFWIWIIQMTVATLLGNPRFELEHVDQPFVAGHSVSSTCRTASTSTAPAGRWRRLAQLYFEHTHRELDALLAGNGRREAIQPAPGLPRLPNLA